MQCGSGVCTRPNGRGARGAVDPLLELGSQGPHWYMCMALVLQSKGFGFREILLGPTICFAGPVPHEIEQKLWKL